MSARNGDKARFGKQRKRKMAHRARTRDLRESIKPEEPAAALNAEPPQPPEQNPASHATGQHGVLGSTAHAIGSVLGSLAAKAKLGTDQEPAPAE
ncbi:MAG: hypothetical protein M3Z09_02155 [Acidobacteriota bacterium]|nr:hypothetical protein [Acidobacteriota bacterium]